ncbi:MAG: FtsW/RodA/SpoVE family cell cycle protein, partial [Firmicutes bacterium]|nr:FtsW/RodA/SpoVE family cell cycle protein [Bacillota bacterium]
MSRENHRMPDFLLFASALLLVSLGLVMVYSASSVMAMAETGDPLHYVKRQLVGVIVGTVAMLFLMQIDYRIYQRLANVGVALAYLLLVVVLIQGAEIGGSRRW